MKINIFLHALFWPCFGVHVPGTGTLCVVIFNDTRFFSASFTVHCCLVWCVGAPRSFFAVPNECDSRYLNHSSQKNNSISLRTKVKRRLVGFHYQGPHVLLQKKMDKNPQIRRWPALNQTTAMLCINTYFILRS